MPGPRELRLYAPGASAALRWLEKKRRSSEAFRCIHSMQMLIMPLVWVERHMELSASRFGFTRVSSEKKLRLVFDLAGVRRDEAVLAAAEAALGVEAASGEPAPAVLLLERLRLADLLQQRQVNVRLRRPRQSSLLLLHPTKAVQQIRIRLIAT